MQSRLCVKKQSAPTCLEISKVAEDNTAPLSKLKESVGINLLQNTNIKSGFVYERKNYFFFLPIKKQLL